MRKLDDDSPQTLRWKPTWQLAHVIPSCARMQLGFWWGFNGAFTPPPSRGDLGHCDMALWHGSLIVVWSLLPLVLLCSFVPLPGSCCPMVMALCLPLSASSGLNSGSMLLSTAKILYRRVWWLLLTWFHETLLGFVVVLGMQWFLCSLSWFAALLVYFILHLTVTMVHFLIRSSARLPWWPFRSSTR